MNGKLVLKMLQNDRWYEVNREGSHIQLKHPIKPGKVTVPMHKELKRGTLNSIMKQAGLK